MTFHTSLGDTEVSILTNQHAIVAHQQLALIEAKKVTPEPGEPEID